MDRGRDGGVNLGGWRVEATTMRELSWAEEAAVKADMVWTPDLERQTREGYSLRCLHCDELYNYGHYPWPASPCRVYVRLLEDQAKVESIIYLNGGEEEEAA